MASVPSGCTTCRVVSGFRRCRIHGWVGAIDGPEELDWFLRRYPRDREQILEAARSQGVTLPTVAA